MKDHVQAAVIGGGVVGCSVLYHLTKMGWKDVCLIERSELTSGSTWHAAGGFHTLSGDPNVAKLQDYTIRLYAEIEEISGQSCGLHMTGGVMLAGTQDRLDFLKMARGKARYLGLQDMEIISVDEAAELFPLMDNQSLSVLCTMPMKVILTRPARRMPMPKRPACRAPKSICATASSICNIARTALGM